MTTLGTYICQGENQHIILANVEATTCEKCGSPIKWGMSKAEFIEATGVTYRKVDYWIRKADLPLTLNDPNRGSGHFRLYDADAVEKVVLLGRLSEALGGIIPIDILKYVFDHYDDHVYEICPNVYLEW